MVAFLEKMKFWKNKKSNYKLVEAKNGISCIEITSGKYSGVIYSYGTVKFSEEFGIPKLKFDYEVLQTGNYDVEALNNDQEFVTIMGDILTNIIIENEPIRTNNSQESDLQ